MHTLPSFFCGVPTVLATVKPSCCIHIQMQAYISNRSISHMGNHQSNLIGKRVYLLNYLNWSVCVCVCVVCVRDLVGHYIMLPDLQLSVGCTKQWAELSWAELSKTNPSAAQSGVKITLTVSHICTVCTLYNQPIIMFTLSSLLLYILFVVLLLFCHYGANFVIA